MAKRQAEAFESDLDGEIEVLARKIRQRLRRAPGGRMQRTALSRLYNRNGGDAAILSAAIRQLVESGEVVAERQVDAFRRGITPTFYVLTERIP